MALTPSFGGERGRGRSETKENEVVLGVRGTARTSEEVLAFIDSLFAHESFRVPNLSKESLRDDQLIDFSLTVIYAPTAPPAEPAETVAAEAAESAEGEAAAAAAAEDGGDGAPAAAAGEETTG